MAGNALARSDGREQRGTAVEIRAAGYALTTQTEVDSDATMLRARWSNSSNLQEDDFRSLAIIARECGMNPIFDLDVLGGRPFDNANFWRGLLAAHPHVQSIEQHRIQPGTPEWDEWIGVDEPDVVAAAILTRVVMRNRTMPIVEANYVLKTDSILYEGEKAQSLGPGPEGQAKARELEARGVKVWLAKQEGAKPREWMAKQMSLMPDWRARALKKARSTALRRCAKVAVPMEHARVLRGMDRMERLIETREQSGARAVVATQPDPYTALSTGGDSAAPTVSRQLAAPTVIAEEHRRMLWGQAKEKGLDEVDLKALIARVLGIARDQVSTKLITYEQLPVIVDAIQAIPDPGFDDIDAEDVATPSEGPRPQAAAAAGEISAAGEPDYSDVPLPAEDPRLDLGGGW